jgi:hypothetical protein
MGGSEGGNVNAEMPRSEILTLADELRQETIKALQTIQTAINGLTPEDRWKLAAQLDAARRAVLELGVKEPAPEPF